MSSRAPLSFVLACACLFACGSPDEGGPPSAAGKDGSARSERLDVGAGPPPDGGEPPSAPVDGATLRDAGASDAPPTSAFAGLWGGQTPQKSSFYFRVTNDGRIPELYARVLLSYAGTGCWVSMRTRETPIDADGRALLVLSNAETGVKLDGSLRFSAAGTVEVSLSAYKGRHDVSCPNKMVGVDVSVAAMSFSAERSSPQLVPEAAEQKVFPADGVAAPAGSYDGACTQTGARWCAIVRNGSAGGELWVMNMDAPAAACDPSKPNPACLRLSTTLWTERAPRSGTASPYAHRFSGDTLIFQAQAVTPAGAGFVGTVYGWRPGMIAAQPLTSEVGRWCRAGAEGVVVCADNVQGASGMPTTMDLLVGTVGGGELLRKAATITISQPEDPANAMLRFTTQLSPDGKLLGWSNRTGKTLVDPEPLHVLAWSDKGSQPRLLAPDVADWVFSADGRRIYGLRARPSSAAGSFDGVDLVAVDVSSGTVRVLGRGVRAFDVLTSDGPVHTVLARMVIGRDLVAVRVPEQGNVTNVVLDSGVDSIRRLSPDGRRVAYARRVQPGGTATDLRVATVSESRTNPCVVTETTEVEGGVVVFSSSGDHIVWSRDLDGEDGQTEGWSTHIPTCETRGSFPQMISWYRLPGDRFLAVTEHLRIDPFGFANVQLLDLNSQRWTTIHKGVDARFNLQIWSDARDVHVRTLVGRHLGWGHDGVWQRVTTYPK